MIRILPYILLGLLFYIVLFYMEDYQPEIMNDVLIKVDVLGLTNVAKEEQDRIYAINSLGIDVTHPEKQALINHTIFMGATPAMVGLALGGPKIQKWNTLKTKLYYIYYLPNDNRPTVLVFKQDTAGPTFKLYNAYKSSALDIANLHIDDTP